ncbi:Threonine dehydratase [uncultured delta proteobacterium]|uniref:threonine ammonia-lyase n=1 Tax=uncultured delta proteobacterium TaxID=34034 RepID=A0A212J6M1_9DELT|nr:Threonine dehydratase [uncultured delta proteobacterium]
MDSIESFRRAEELLEPVIARTPLTRSGYFSSVTGNEVFFKAENLQVTGAYKIRGAYCKISQMPEAARARGIITSSAGNHAQGVAYAAKVMGAEAVIVMPSTTPLVKVNNTKKYGATVILHGDAYDEAYVHAAKLAEEKGYTFVHPFNDLEVATGQGTIAAEIYRGLPGADIILVPIGGGGLAAGVSTYAKMLNPAVRIIGVEPVGAASMHASLKKGAVTTLPTLDTIADGVAVKTPGDKVFPYIQANVADIILVDDREIPDAFLDMAENHKMIIETAGLLTVAALKHLGVTGKKVVSVLSGGNMDVLGMATLVHHGLISRGRVFSFTLTLPDKPGQLATALKIISELRGNIIRVEHNQFAYINRNAAVEVEVTLEAFGHEHKEEILNGLSRAGLVPTTCAPKPVW